MLPDLDSLLSAPASATEPQRVQRIDRFTYSARNIMALARMRGAIYHEQSNWVLIVRGSRHQLPELYRAASTTTRNWLSNSLDECLAREGRTYEQAIGVNIDFSELGEWTPEWLRLRQCVAEQIRATLKFLPPETLDLATWILRDFWFLLATGVPDETTAWFAFVFKSSGGGW